MQVESYVTRKGEEMKRSKVMSGGKRKREGGGGKRKRDGKKKQW
jgi:hypothetical protein